jgi:hypothetical protein
MNIIPKAAAIFSMTTATAPRPSRARERLTSGQQDDVGHLAKEAAVNSDMKTNTVGTNGISSAMALANSSLSDVEDWTSRWIIGKFADPST